MLRKPVRLTPTKASYRLQGEGFAPSRETLKGTPPPAPLERAKRQQILIKRIANLFGFAIRKLTLVWTSTKCGDLLNYQDNCFARFERRFFWNGSGAAAVGPFSRRRHGDPFANVSRTRSRRNLHFRLRPVVTVAVEIN